jgi:periplasmic protein TonB
MMLNALTLNTNVPSDLGRTFVQKDIAPKQPKLKLVVPAAPVTPSFDERRRGWMPFAVVVALHVLLIAAIQSGVAKKVVSVVVPEKMALTYIAPLASETPSVKPLAKTTPATVATPVVPQPVLSTTRPSVVAVAATTPVADVPPAPVQSAHSIAPSSPAPVVSAPVVPAQPKTITTGVEYIQKPQPTYPALAKRAGEQGRVMLRVLVNEKGLPESASVSQSSGFNRLDEAARQAVLQARFKPYLEDGRALPVFVLVPISFEAAAS